MSCSLRAILVTLSVLAGLPNPAFGDSAAVRRLLVGRDAEATLRLPFDAPELVDPRSALPDLEDYPIADLSALLRYSRGCRAEDLAEVGHPSLTKARAWHRYLCKGQPDLPSGFFDSTPRFHPGGSSFVALAAGSGQDRFDRAWLRDRMHRLHVLESDVLEALGLPLDDERRVLHGLSPVTLRRLVDRESLVVTERHVFVLDAGQGPADPGAYRAYPRSHYDAIVTPRPAGNGRTLLWVAIATGALLTVVALWQAARRMRLRRQLMHERARVLRTLAHEVRTPTSSLKLVLEELRRGYDDLPPDAQKGFLTLCDEVHRLERVIRESSRYLGAFHEDPTGAYRRVPIDSVNAFVEGVIEPYRERIAFEPLSEDPGVVTDPYWFAVCIRNLVENALTHGAPPVVVRLRADRRRLHLTVSDGGTARARELQRGLRPFLRARSSPGLGLGLAIVADTVAGLRGKLTWGTRPTRFTMSLRRST